jgi:hypothetical protein
MAIRVRQLQSLHSPDPAGTQAQQLAIETAARWVNRAAAASTGSLGLGRTGLSIRPDRWK